MAIPYLFVLAILIIVVVVAVVVGLFVLLYIWYEDFSNKRQKKKETAAIIKKLLQSREEASRIVLQAVREDNPTLKEHYEQKIRNINAALIDLGYRLKKHV